MKPLPSKLLNYLLDLKCQFGIFAALMSKRSILYSGLLAVFFVFSERVVAQELDWVLIDQAIGEQARNLPANHRAQAQEIMGRSLRAIDASASKAEGFYPTLVWHYSTSLAVERYLVAELSQFIDSGGQVTVFVDYVLRSFRTRVVEDLGLRTPEKVSLVVKQLDPQTVDEVNRIRAILHLNSRDLSLSIQFDENDTQVNFSEFERWVNAQRNQAQAGSSIDGLRFDQVFARALVEFIFGELSTNTRQFLRPTNDGPKRYPLVYASVLLTAWEQGTRGIIQTLQTDVGLRQFFAARIAELGIKNQPEWVTRLLSTTLRPHGTLGQTLAPAKGSMAPARTQTQLPVRSPSVQLPAPVVRTSWAPDWIRSFWEWVFLDRSKTSQPPRVELDAEVVATENISEREAAWNAIRTGVEEAVRKLPTYRAGGDTTTTTSQTFGGRFEAAATAFKIQLKTQAELIADPEARSEFIFQVGIEAEVDLRGQGQGRFRMSFTEDFQESLGKIDYPKFKAERQVQTALMLIELGVKETHTESIVRAAYFLTVDDLWTDPNGMDPNTTVAEVVEAKLAQVPRVLRQAALSKALSQLRERTEKRRERLATSSQRERSAREAVVRRYQRAEAVIERLIAESPRAIQGDTQVATELASANGARPLIPAQLSDAKVWVKGLLIEGKFRTVREMLGRERWTSERDLIDQWERVRGTVHEARFVEDLAKIAVTKGVMEARSKL